MIHFALKVGVIDLLRNISPKMCDLLIRFVRETHKRVY